MTAAEPGKLTWALKYASLGIGVFPLAKGSKVPLGGSHGHRSATTEAATIRSWFAQEPALNWGAVGGAQRFNFDADCIEHLVWVDLDLAPGKDGRQALADMCGASGINLADLDTLTIRTPSGGLHLGFYTDKPLRQGANVLGPGTGVDVRTFEGYVVGPGSRVNGKAYEVIVDAPIASMGRLADIFPTATPTKKADITPLPGIDPDRARDRALAYLKTAPTEGDPDAYPVACKLKDLGCTEEQAVELMQEFWDPLCEPPRTDDTATVVHNAFKYGREPQGSAAPEAVFQPEPEGEAPTTQRRRSLDVFRWADFRDRAVQPTKWVWGAFFPSVPFGVLASHPGHGKSILSLQIAVAVATGLPLFGSSTCGPAGAGVLALEDDANVVHRRLKAIRESYGLSWTEAHDELMQANFVLMVRARGPESGAALQLSKLARELGEAMGGTKDAPAILFLDTLNAVNGGDENSNTETRELVATIFGLHDSLNCSVWALHHLRKAGSGRNAPPLTDRLDPELVRGAGALVGSARGVVQFGWVNPNEAVKAGLDPENSQRRYAVMGLTKVNDGPLSPWLLLEHEKKPAGIWAPTVDGERALAILRGGNAKERLERAEAMLLDLYEHAGADAGEIRPMLLERHFPGDPKASEKLKGALQDLRRRRGWLKPASLALTEEGAKEALRLKGRQSIEDCLPDEQESFHELDSA